MGFVSEFKEFAVKGNVVDLAVGVIIGAAFKSIVDSVVKDLVMPVVSLALGNLDFSNKFIVLGDLPKDYAGAMTYAELTKVGVPLFAWGNFVTVSLNFFILAFIIFLMVRQINRLKRKEEVAAPAPAPVTPEDVLLLREIRDAVTRSRSV